MESFISTVVSEFKTKNLNTCCFILPSRRAAQAFTKELYLAKDDGFLVPPIMSIEEFIEEVAEVTLIDSLETLFHFYSVYKEYTNPNKQEPIEQVYNWGQSIIQDFNEIDRYQIDSKQFFGNLKAIKDIEHWSKSEIKTDLVNNYIEFWEQLPKYHKELKNKLKSQQKAYQGMAYQEAVSKIKSYIDKNNKQFYFIGFNALNSCEETIFQYILSEKRGEVFWDIDAHLLKTNAAGLFIRGYTKNWAHFSKTPLEATTTHFSNKKDIHHYGVPKKIGQAKLVGDILSKLSKEELNETAVVLADESLLQPVLNALPSSLTKANVTMGLPLEATSFASFFNAIFKIRTTGQEDLHYKQIFELIEHPALKKAFSRSTDYIKNDFSKNNLIFQSRSEFLNNYKALDDSFAQILNLSLANTDLIVDKFLNNCLQIIELLKPSFKDEVLSLEYLFGFKKLFIKLQNFLEKSDLIQDFKVFYQIYQDMLSAETLDFEGSPYEGLQIMGMLETRVLDFKTIIITSVNEGVLPSGKSQNSFIPFDLKKAYHLPTFKEKDAIYAYHFFRLMQKAETCHFIYNNSTTGVEKAEKSRFLTQLETFSMPKHRITKYTVTSGTASRQQPLKQVKKTPEMLQMLKTHFQTGISPTALTTYIRNPIDFYERYILQLNETKEIEEDISYSTFGSAIHDCLEAIYKNQLSKVLTKDSIDNMLNTYPQFLLAEFHKKFTDDTLMYGKNLIDFEIAKQQVKRFLLQEKKSLETNSIKVIELESKDEALLSLETLNLKVKLKGKVDRVDMINDQLRIIDYKTGKVESKQLKIPSDWQELTENYEYSKAFQVLFYALLKEDQLSENSQAGIISFKNLNQGFMPCNAKNSNLKELVADFKIELKRLILDILDPKIPFTEKLV